MICALFPEFKVRYKSSKKERDLTRGKPGPKVEQKFFEGRLSQQIRSLDIPTSIVVVTMLRGEYLVIDRSFPA